MTCFTISLDRWVEPAAMFRHLVRGPYPFWLDSSLLSGRLGRFSFMGDAPFLILRRCDGRTEVIRETEVRQIDQDPLDTLAGIMETHRTSA